MKNINIDFKILGEHFAGDRNIKSVIEQMRKLKRKYEATGKSLWAVYVKAYNFDVGEPNGVVKFINSTNIIGGKFVHDEDTKVLVVKNEPKIIKALEK